MSVLNIAKLELSVNPQSLQAVDNFNNGVFSTADLSPDSYYIKVGYGQETVKTINKQCRQSFPKKSLSDLNIILGDRDVISYASLVKEVQYFNPFETVQSFYFTGIKVKGFEGHNQTHLQNIELLNYDSDKQFLLRLKLKQQNEQLYGLKTQKSMSSHDVCEAVSVQHKIIQLQEDDVFAMPVLELDVKRQYKQLVGSKIKNGNLSGYQLTTMMENIKFKMDQIGAKVQNQAVMVLPDSVNLQPKIMIMSKPFWVVMAQKGCHPYFVAHITNIEFMMKI